MKDKKKLLLFILCGVAFLTVLILIIISFRQRNLKLANNERNHEQEVSADDEYNEALFGPVLDEGPTNLTLEITYPKEEKIFPGQARQYMAYAVGEGTYSNMANCHWDFYVNEYNEEVLYQTMDNRSAVSNSKTDVCGFVSTFMDKIGKVRIVLTMSIYDHSLKNVIQTVTAEKNYVVAR